MTDLRTAPAGAKPARGSQDRRRILRETKKAVNSFLYDLDIREPDVTPDAQKLERVIHDLADLAYAAFARNHSVY